MGELITVFAAMFAAWGIGFYTGQAVGWGQGFDTGWDLYRSREPSDV